MLGRAAVAKSCVVYITSPTSQLGGERGEGEHKLFDEMGLFQDCVQFRDQGSKARAHQPFGERGKRTHTVVR